MKTFTTILKVLAALAAVAGIIYVVATFGDRIVAWAKELLNKLGWFGRKKKNEFEDFEDLDEELDADDTDFEG